jgi:hypothetical protein
VFSIQGQESGSMRLTAYRYSRETVSGVYIQVWQSGTKPGKVKVNQRGTALQSEGHSWSQYIVLVQQKGRVRRSIIRCRREVQSGTVYTGTAER